MVPSNWDSWGKIRIIREGFDIEGVGTSWSIEIQDPPGTNDAANNTEQEADNQSPDDGTSAVAIYEQTIQDPKRDMVASNSSQTEGEKIEIETVDSQTFLGEQVSVLEQLKAEDEKQERQIRKGTVMKEENVVSLDEGRVNEHIGPVQFNMGGIQVDADDMLRKLKVSHTFFSRQHSKSAQRRNTSL